MRQMIACGLAFLLAVVLSTAPTPAAAGEHDLLANPKPLVVASATAKPETAATKTKKKKKRKKAATKATPKPSALSQAAAAAGDDAAGLAPCYVFKPAGKSRCEPQCIPYARCRSGIMSCRLGRENGPLTWYACENKHRNTSHMPEDGAVLILDRDTRHGMPTGHAIYVEHAEPDGLGGFLLTVSHTNFDRRCHLETTVLARYDPAKKTIDMRSGAWLAWGQSLKVAGFIRP